MLNLTRNTQAAARAGQSRNKEEGVSSSGKQQHPLWVLSSSSCCHSCIESKTEHDSTLASPIKLYS